LVKVSLDGAETKSEDYQRDVRRSAAPTPMIALKSFHLDPESLAASGHVFDLESVAG